MISKKVFIVLNIVWKLSPNPKKEKLYLFLFKNGIFSVFCVFLYWCTACLNKELLAYIKVKVRIVRIEYKIRMRIKKMRKRATERY